MGPVPCFGEATTCRCRFWINGLATGSVYALIATGFALIFNVLKFSNFFTRRDHDGRSVRCLFSGIIQRDGTHRYPGCRCRARAPLIALFGEFFGFRRITLNHSSPTYFLCPPLRWARSMRAL